MKLRRFLAAATAAAVATSAMAVTSFAVLCEDEIAAGGAPAVNVYKLQAIEGVDYSQVASIEAVVTTSDYVNGTIGVSADTAWTTPGQLEASAGTSTWVLDGLTGIDFELDDGSLKEDVVQVQFWWLNAGSFSLDSLVLLDADGNVLHDAATGAPVDEPVDAPVVDEPVEEPTDDIVIDEPAALTLEECYDGNGTIILVGENGENAYATSNGIDILDVYGYRVTAQFPMAEVNDEEAWIGGGMGTNSNSTGWASTEWGKASGEKPIVTEFDEQGLVTLELLSDASLFAADDAYAQLWIQCWGGTMNIISVEVLGAEGAVIAEATVGEIAAVEDAPAADDTVVDTDAPAADTGKDSPDTGVEGIAAVAGVVALAGVAVVASRKRK